MAAAANVAVAALQQQLQQMQAQMQAQIDVLTAAAAAAGVAPVATDPALLALMRAQLAPITSPAVFRGASAGLEAQRWLSAMVQFFKVAQIASDDDRLSRAGSLLQGPAMLWWQREAQRPAGDANKISSWAQFEAALLKRYQPVDAPQWARTQLQALTLKRWAQVTPYTDRFLEIVALLPLMHEDDQVFQYRSGLPSAAREALATKQFATLEDIMHKALVWEAARAAPATAPGGPASPSSAFRGPSARLNSVGTAGAEGEEPEEAGLEPTASDSSAAIMAQLSRMDARISQLAGSVGQRKPSAQQRRPPGGSNASLNPGRTPGLSDELAQARIKAQLCIHCGQKGHRKRDCTNAADVTTPTN